MKSIAVFRTSGLVRFETVRDGVKISFDLKGFRPNETHAIHIHEYGDLSGGCKSLGGHFNPNKTHHGSWTSCCRHAGDLMNNFTTDNNGTFNWFYIDGSFCVEEIIGRSVVIHQLRDDGGARVYDGLSDREINELALGNSYTGARAVKITKLNEGSTLTGNAGARIDCAVIGLSSS